jgi:hypothetical protein
VVPTNLIYAMTFEARGQPRATNIRVSTFHPEQPRRTADFIHRCQDIPVSDPYVDGLARTFRTRVGTPGMTHARTAAPQVQELITAAVAGITGLRNREGLIAASPTILNIANGAPNNFNPSAVTQYTTNGQIHAMTVLKAKAAALIREVTLANQTALTQARDAILALPAGTAMSVEINNLLTPWLNCLRTLFGGAEMPAQGPFQQDQVLNVLESTDTEQFSPVFPVSDALGYEHYGSYQYGRGLSIEPGGNYERLMATDPLQYASPAAVEALLHALRSNPDSPELRRQAVVNAGHTIANDPAFQNGPGAQVALAYQENSQRNEDRTTQIANGLANYIMSDRDAVMKLPVNNVAYRLADLGPMGQEDACGCRGAEADLLLAAYMSGTDNFALIDSREEAQNWVAGQMEQAVGAWAEAQSQMRGMSMDQGRRSLLDSVDGWSNIANQFERTNTSLADRLDTTSDSTSSLRANTERLGVEAENIASRPSDRRPVPPRGQ